MAVLFSKVKLIADNGCNATLLCSGCPRDNYDLEDWTIYQKFMSDNLHCPTAGRRYFAVKTISNRGGDDKYDSKNLIALSTGRG